MGFVPRLGNVFWSLNVPPRKRSMLVFGSRQGFRV